ncbi:MerR family DNA-binding protein [Halopseudomonas nanhaiensis]|uniref:MerR family DNA-binding protein n=1 Tax=Halopseudomonas nanhaiensis TaxID=2830842 RepID=UPI003C306717
MFERLRSLCLAGGGWLSRLALIALGRSAGFSLDEIARMLGADGRPEIDRQLLADKAEGLEAPFES